MRERLTAAFVLLSVILLLFAGVLRSYSLRDLIRDQERNHLQQEATLVGAIVEDRTAAGEPINRAFLAGLVDAQSRLEYEVPGQPALVVRGADYHGADDSTQDVSVTDRAGRVGTVTVSQSPEIIRALLIRDLGSLIALFLLIGVLAGVVGFYVSRALSSPFRRLAVAAGALGRGRFDLDLPRTRIPEALAIAQALRTSAVQLQSRLSRERDFAEHASHVLKTPLTGLRLELEELTLRDDVPGDAKAAAQRCIASVDEINTVAEELVALSRRGSLVEGAEASLHDVATQLAERWDSRLDGSRRTLAVTVDGDLDLRFTPGPVEQMLDLVIADVVERGGGALRIHLHGESDHLRIRLPDAVLPDRSRGGRRPGERIAQARTIAESLGGRLAGDGSPGGVEILVPSR